MSFVEFSRVGSASTVTSRTESYQLHDKGSSKLTTIKPSRSPNAKILKTLILPSVVSVTVVVSLVVCLIIFLGHGHGPNDDDKNNDNRKTTLSNRKDKLSSAPTTPIPPTPTNSSITTLSTPMMSTTTPSSTSTTTTTITSTTTTKAASTTETTLTFPISSSTAISTGSGIWSNWGAWTMCAVTCGNSIYSRYRACIKNTVNDTNCVGNFKEQKECTTTTCPAYGTWTTWQSWSNCDSTCGGGTQTRSRSCVKLVNTDNDCVGGSSQQQTCNDWACPDCSKVCSVGTLNSQCDVCECSTNTQALVTNSNGGPLSNVSVAHESAPNRELATTNENGLFTLDNVCANDAIVLRRSGYQDTTVTITASSLIIVMPLLQYPLITLQPKSHLRLKGESVQFCCNATGNPAITSYEWLMNGNLLNETLYPEGTTLTLDNLKFMDSGNVICRANSPVGAVFSDSVSLLVREKPDDFCSDAYESYEINLPSDCIQADTNSIKYDIGRCSPKNCRTNISGVQQGCSVDKKYCCTPSARERRIIQCTGYTFPLYVTTSCTCGECEDTNITIYGQAVGAISGSPLRFGTIEMDGKSVGSTGLVGDFSFNVPRGTSRVAVIFKDNLFNQFLDTVKIFRFYEDISGRFHFHINIIEATAPINIDSTASNILQLGNENGEESIASLTIPPNSIFYPNGTQYNGVVKASLTFFDPRNSSTLQNAPGEFVSIDSEGETENLQSFGVFSLSLHDQSGSNLQIAGETEIKLDQSFFETNSIGNVSDAKLWGLNPETGVWEEQGTLNVISSKRKKRQSSFLVGTIQISAYLWWNIDVPYSWTYCYFKSEVFEGDERLSSFTVRVIYLTNTASNAIVRFTENNIYSDYPVWAICRIDTPLKSYIGVEKDGRKIPVNLTSSGLSSSAESFIGYQVIEDGRTVSADVRLSESGPFYSSYYSSFQNTFRFKLEKNDYSLKILNPNMQEAILNQHPGNEVWYPPLNSFLQADVQYRTCFIKIGTVNANTNLWFRVSSMNNDSTILGIHEKNLTDGATCIEYRCSVQNPDFTRNVGNDFYRYPKTYTKIRIIPIGQVCSVASESSEIRSQEKSNLGLSLARSNVGDTFFEANIPDNEYEGIFFHKSSSFNGISDARKSAIKECNKGVPDSFSTSEKDMTPNVGLATTFSCL